MQELAEAPNIIKFLSQPLHFQVLEEQLGKSIEEYYELKKQASGFNFGPKLNDHDFNQLFKEVSSETRALLHVSKIENPPVTRLHLPNLVRKSLTGAEIVTGGLFSYSAITTSPSLDNLLSSLFWGAFVGTAIILFSYEEGSVSHLDPKRNKINIGMERLATLPAVISHEYTHYIHGLSGFIFSSPPNPVGEGLAMGVEIIMARRYAQNYDNPAFIYLSAATSAIFLKDAYLDVCDQMQTKPKADLVKNGIRTLSRKIGPIKSHSFSGHHYCLGRALMSVAETLHGPEIYPKILKNDLEFLKTDLYPG